MSARMAAVQGLQGPPRGLSLNSSRRASRVEFHSHSQHSSTDKIPTLKALKRRKSMHYQALIKIHDNALHSACLA